jgi:hypothetical protein
MASSPKALRTELVISAKDQTGAAFDAVGRRFDRLAVAGKRVDGVGRDFLNLGSEIDKASRKLETFEKRMARVETLGKRLGRAMGPATAATEAYEASRLTRGLTDRAARAATQGQHERVRMEAAGMAPGEIAEAEAAAAKLSATLPALSQTMILHMLRNARAIVGSYEEAAHIIEPLAELRVAVEGAHPERKEELEGDFDKLQKAMEITGITQDPVRYAKAMNLTAKAMNVFGDTLRPYDFFEFAQRSRLAGQGYSDEFLFGVGPTLMQHMGGASAGQAMSAFYQQFLGGHMTQAAANMMMKYGLLDKSKIEYTKAGLIKRVEPGALKEHDLARANPYGWIQSVFLQALRDKGVKTEAQFQDVGAVLASKATTGQALGILAFQKKNIEKDLALEGGAPGLEAADVYMKKDIPTMWEGFQNQLTNLLQVAASPLMPAAEAGLRGMVDTLIYATEKASGHPIAATGGLLTAISAGGLAAWEGGVYSAGRFGLLSEDVAKFLLRAPLKGVGPLALVTGTLGAWNWVGNRVRNNKGLTAQEKAAIFSTALDPTGAASAYIMSQPRELDIPLADPRLEHSRQLLSDAPKVGGNATVTIKVQADDQLKAHIDDVQNDAHGLDIRSHGSTGSVGKAWDDIGPVPGL